MAKRKGKSRGRKGGARKRTKPNTPRLPIPFRTDGVKADPTLEAKVRETLEHDRQEFEKRRLRDIERASLELDAMDTAILRYALQFPGLTQQQIGNLVGLNREAVNIRMNAPKFERAIASANRSALEIFADNKRRAAVRLGNLIDDPDARIAIRASIAHMWPHIHGEATAAGNDFVTFLQEAFELAEQNRPPAEASAAG